MAVTVDVGIDPVDAVEYSGTQQQRSASGRIDLCDRQCDSRDDIIGQERPRDSKAGGS